ncbi:hypothetical protein DE146DRAFT_760631 [Phaeosphaeria sp. MPI-PUGE-AT-0046c]|nr:hypothetical protein DE146DRAFT_760631 [Phaeosphaeria sp. MPI-PUGE-AT-0046c]
MPAINITRTILEPVASSVTSSTQSLTGYVNDPTTSASIIASSSLKTSESAVWSIPVIIGAILAILAIVGGLPSAVLALQEIRKRRQAMTDDNDEPIDDTKANSKGVRNIGGGPNVAGSDIVYKKSDARPQDRSNVSTDVESRRRNQEEAT